MADIEKNNSIYLSLQEAAEVSPYSQEYLSLRARQGKLRAIKLGRNWVTTKEWLQEYFEKAGEYKNGNGDASKTAPSPPNLPIEIIFTPAAFNWKFAFVLYSVLILFAGAAFFGKNSLIEVFKDTNPYVVSFNSTIDRGISAGLKISGSAIHETRIFAKENLIKPRANAPKIFPKTAGKEKFTAGVLSSISDTARNIVRFIGNAIHTGASKIAGKFRNGWQTLARLWSGPEKETKTGMVVVPSDENDAAFEKQVAKNFSDEVKVEIQDETSGIITPIFKEKIGDRYFFIMVPIDN